MKCAVHFWNMPLSQLPSDEAWVPICASPAVCATMAARWHQPPTASSSCLPWGNRAASPWDAPTGGSEEICLQRRDGRRTWKYELLLSSAHRFPLVLNLWHWHSLLTCSDNICHSPWACWNLSIASCLWLCRKWKIVLCKLNENEISKLIPK